MDTEIRKQIYYVAAKGEKDHGPDGVVMYEPALEESLRFRWAKLTDVKPDDLPETLREFLDDEGELVAFVMEVREDKAHIWKIPRGDILPRRR